MQPLGSLRSLLLAVGFADPMVTILILFFHAYFFFLIDMNLNEGSRRQICTSSSRKRVGNWPEGVTPLRRSIYRYHVAKEKKRIGRSFKSPLSEERVKKRRQKSLEVRRMIPWLQEQVPREHVVALRKSNPRQDSKNDLEKQLKHGSADELPTTGMQGPMVVLLQQMSDCSQPMMRPQHGLHSSSAQKKT